jgi:N-acetylglutamate synthase-like GNAT family acetyltransferase
MDMLFRHAGPADVDRICEISRPFMASGALIVRERAFFADHITEFHVVETGRDVVACVGASRVADTVEIFNFVVGNNWQGLGMGDFLISNLIARMSAAGSRTFILFSKTAGEWFLRYGFRPMEPACVPAERLALNDPARGSIALYRVVDRVEGIPSARGPAEELVGIESPRRRNVS